MRTQIVITRCYQSVHFVALVECVFILSFAKSVAYLFKDSRLIGQIF